jgi:asparagine N-glycosylation enzyme membrane subunit Stt3
LREEVGMKNDIVTLIFYVIALICLALMVITTENWLVRGVLLIVFAVVIIQILGLFKEDESK